MKNSNHYNKKLSEVRIGKYLKKSSTNNDLFKEKLDEANKTLKRVGLPDGYKKPK